MSNNKIHDNSITSGLYTKNACASCLKKPELLAPAGNKETFYAVLRAGADAVYLAGNKFGARAYADNFSEEELCECIKYAHLYNRRVYLTVNTLLNNSELEELDSFLRPLYEEGLDGVIIQDLGVISYIRDHFPNMELHASTQLNTTGIEGSLFLKNQGICRIVPARELSLMEVIKIKKETGLAIECFIHGAICYCYSGQCLFSSVIGGRSGNRGRCAQPCRLPYSADGLNDIYPLSLKDMCTIECLPKLIEAGIDSFKIEGRMKKPEYAAGVTSLYRKYIDQYFKTGTVNVSVADKKTLSTLYIRSEISEGYYERYNGAEMVSLKSPSYNGSDEKTLQEINSCFVGSNASKQLPKIELSGSAYFVTGEQAILTLNYGDISVTSYGDIVMEAQKKPVTVEDITKQVNKLGATVFSLDEVDFARNSYISENAYYNLKGINELRRDAISKIEAAIINGFGLISSGVRNNPSSKIEAFSGDNTFISSKHNSFPDIPASKNGISVRATGINIQINDFNQLKALKDFIAEYKNKAVNKIKRVYIPEELFLTDLSVSSDNAPINSDEFYELLEWYNYQGINIYAALPYIRRIKDLKILHVFYDFIVTAKAGKYINGFLVKNIEDLNSTINFCKEYSDKFHIATDYGIYAWNSLSIKTITDASEFISSIGLPLELRGAEHKKLIEYISERCILEKMIYGRIPLMHTANCINKTLNKCNAGKKLTNEQKWTEITDRTRRKLPVFTDCCYCQNTIYNAVPLTLTNELKNYQFDTTFRIDFTNENRNEVLNVLKYYITGDNEVCWEYTKGFEKHSTE